MIKIISLVISMISALGCELLIPPEKQQDQQQLPIEPQPLVAIVSVECDCGCGRGGCDCQRSSLKSPRNLSRTTPAGSPASAPGRHDAVASVERREIAEADNRPVVVLYAPDWCQACQPVRAAFAARDGLPFRLIVKGEADGVQSFPTIRWVRSTDGAVMSFDHRNWQSVDNVIAGWKANR